MTLPKSTLDAIIRVTRDQGSQKIPWLSLIMLRTDDILKIFESISESLYTITYKRPWGYKCGVLGTTENLTNHTKLSLANKVVPFKMWDVELSKMRIIDGLPITPSSIQFVGLTGAGDWIHVKIKEDFDSMCFLDSRVEICKVTLPEIAELIDSKTFYHELAKTIQSQAWEFIRRADHLAKLADEMNTEDDIMSRLNK